ncbi:DUF3310 domain-containing protein [Vreelandella andesensis]|uniref:DUF3310 domain-containing protein n=1 Tax=Vreelandella andesensis TaxID=447567 RepID=A0A3S0WEP4_9GAMM|nr:DUF3310 domain-containing protein [Halomonas andesensis]RUR26824.1 DUF3310 domain-containing protein [Halomonas andesensis]
MSKREIDPITGFPMHMVDPGYEVAGPVAATLEKQPRYQDAKGEDWIDEFARTATADEFRGAMRFTIGKYNRRAGKKDALISEIRKMRDYCQRWEDYELALRGDQ